MYRILGGWDDSPLSLWYSPSMYKWLYKTQIHHILSLIRPIIPWHFNRLLYYVGISGTLYIEPTKPMGLFMMGCISPIRTPLHCGPQYYIPLHIILLNRRFLYSFTYSDISHGPYYLPLYVISYVGGVYKVGEFSLQ